MTSPRPAVVWVTPSLSAEARSGGEIRTQRLLAAAAAVFDLELVVVGARSTAEALRASTGCRRVHAYPTDVEPIRRRVRAVTRAWPLASAGWWHPDAAALVAHHVRDGATLVVDHVWVAGYAPREGLVILLTHNAEARALAEQPLPRGVVPSIEARWNRWATARLERGALARADLVVAVSQQDAVTMGHDAVIVPNGTDVPSATPPRPRSGRVLFVGSFDYPPNADAVRWWDAEIWPALQGKAPPLTVVGRGAERCLMDLADRPSVDIVGEVPDVTSYLREASLVVVPIRRGGGTRLKVLEAMAWNRPVVSTRKGAEGIPVRDGVDIVLADDASTFSQAVTEIYGDDQRAGALAAAGRAIAEQFAWSSMTTKFTDALSQLVH